MDAIKATSEDGVKKRCNSWIVEARYEGEVKLRAVCLNSRRVVHYDTVKRTTCVKEEDEALYEIVFVIIINSPKPRHRRIPLHEPNMTTSDGSCKSRIPVDVLHGLT